MVSHLIRRATVAAIASTILLVAPIASSESLLDIYEIARAFRAIGIGKRTGAKGAIDAKMFQAFDTNGDGKVTPAEFEANMPVAVRQKIEEKLNGGWKFDPIT